MENGVLCHYGVIGQKWGVRRYQNPDGTLTAEGRKRYAYAENVKKVADNSKQMNALSTIKHMPGTKKMLKDPQIKKAEKEHREAQNVYRKTIREVSPLFDKARFKNGRPVDDYDGGADSERYEDDMVKWLQKNSPENYIKYRKAFDNANNTFNEYTKAFVDYFSGTPMENYKFVDNDGETKTFVEEFAMFKYIP